MAHSGAMITAITLLMLGLAVTNLPSVISCPHDHHNHGLSKNGTELNHNLIIGQMRNGTRLIHHEIVHVKQKQFQSASKELNYQIACQVIEYVSIIDLKTDGTGGYPSVVGGGIGKHNITISLRARKHHGLDFYVSVYGQE